MVVFQDIIEDFFIAKGGKGNDGKESFATLCCPNVIKWLFE